MKIFEDGDYIEIVTDLYWYLIAKPLITDKEIIMILILGFPREITEKIIEAVKTDNLQTKIYILTLEFKIHKMFNRYTNYYLDGEDFSEIFTYDPSEDEDRSYGLHYSYIDYDTDNDNFSLDIDSSD